MPDKSTVIPAASLPIVRIGLAALGVVFWLVLVGVGTARMMRYESTAGVTGEAPALWPAESGLHREAGRATLVMFAHPKCPCSRASVAELAEMVAANPGRVTAQVLFLKAENTDDDWTQTELWRSAAAIPGVTVSVDAAGVEAARFGGKTSGDVVLYEASGRLAFHGGITAARGHFGENDGRTALSTLLAGQVPAQSRTPVYGCPLSNPRNPSHCIP